MPTQNFRVGEMLNKRTRNSKTWINFDGSYTTEIYAGDVHYQDENGNWHNIDTDLYDEADLDQVDFPVAREGADVFRIMKDAAKRMKRKGILDRDMMDYQGLKVPFDCRIPKNFKRGYTIGKGSTKLRFIPVGASPTKGHLEEGKENCVHYQDAWNDTDVCLEVMPNGIKETIILKSDRAPVSFSFEVDGPLEDDLTAGEMRLQPAWLQDANGEKRDVSHTIRREGDKTFIDLVTDVAGLAYPIEIDPTVTIAPSDSSGIDTFVDSSSPTVNHGTSTVIFLGKNTSSDDIIGLFRFDYGQIPAGSYISNAKLSLYYNGNWANGNLTGQTGYNVPFNVHKILSSWDELSVNYNTRPSLDAAYSTTKLKYGIFQFYDFNVTDIVADQINGLSPNYGFAVKIDPNSPYYFGPQIISSDNGGPNVPKLTVTYNAPPTAPTVTSPNGGETWNSLHTITWNAATDPSDLETINILSTYNGSLTFDSYTIKRGQQLSIANKYIKQIGLLMETTGSTQFYMRLCNMDGNGYAGTTVYAQALKTKTGSGLSFVYLDVNQKLPSGTYCKLAHYFRIPFSNYFGRIRK